MTDRELLEAAAKAARNGAEWYSSLGMGIDIGGPFPKLWDPLTDDGDALRLAVTLRLDIELSIGDDILSVDRWDPDAEKYVTDISEARGSDAYAATRRAIVRAAAEIGKATA